MSRLYTPVLPPLLQQRVAGELRAGEKLLWAAQPLPRLYRRQAIGLVLFGLPWTGFAVFWVWGASQGAQHAPGPFMLFPLFGLPFVLIGLGMLTSPFWLQRKAQRSLYAITNQRAIVFDAKLFGGQRVQSFSPDRLTAMTREERADGSGDLIFEQFQQRAGSGTTTVRRGFVGVERVREVEEVILSNLVGGRVRAVEE